MLAYEDWIKDNFGDSGVPEADKPEKKNSEELKQEKQEMVWLDWDFRGNPHTRWKYILEKEKRRKEREEKDNRREKDSENNYDRKRDREESNSRKYHRRDESRKRDDYDGERRGKHRHHDSDREERRGRDDDRHRRRDKNYDLSYRDKIRNESTSKDSHSSRYKGTIEEKKDGKYRRDSWDKSKYTKSECRERFKQEDDYRYEQIEKHLGKGSGNHKDKNIDSRISTQNKYDGRLERDERSKEIKSEDNGEYVNTSYETELVKKETFAESTDSDSSSDSTSSSSSRREKKRKKSKKKHKHKHKKKHRKH